MSRVQLLFATFIGVGCFITVFVTALVAEMALDNYYVLAVTGWSSLKMHS